MIHRIRRTRRLGAVIGGSEVGPVARHLGNRLGHRPVEVKFSRATAFPHEILPAIAPAFAQLFQPEGERLAVLYLVEP